MLGYVFDLQQRLLQLLAILRIFVKRIGDKLDIGEVFVFGALPDSDACILFHCCEAGRVACDVPPGAFDDRLVKADAAQRTLHIPVGFKLESHLGLRSVSPAHCRPVHGRRRTVFDRAFHLEDPGGNSRGASRLCGWPVDGRRRWALLQNRRGPVHRRR